MKQIQLHRLSMHYSVKRLSTADIPVIYELLVNNSLFFEYCGSPPSKARVAEDLIATPPNIPISQKYYLGFFDENTLIAILDLIDGYPSEEIAFIGFFMMNSAYQGIGIGSRLINEIFSYLKELGFEAVRLGIDKDNPQSTHFWHKNRFTVLKEIQQESGILLYAERKL